MTVHAAFHDGPRDGEWHHLAYATLFCEFRVRSLIDPAVLAGESEWPGRRWEPLRAVYRRFDHDFEAGTARYRYVGEEDN